MITNRHVAFARAMVALAREHGMNNIDMRFTRHHGSYLGTPDPDEPKGPDRFQQVRIHWQRGRHDASGRIKFSTEEQCELPEDAEGQGGADAS